MQLFESMELSDSWEQPVPVATPGAASLSVEPPAQPGPPFLGAVPASSDGQWIDVDNNTGSQVAVVDAELGAREVHACPKPHVKLGARKAFKRLRCHVEQIAQ